MLKRWFPMFRAALIAGIFAFGLIQPPAKAQPSVGAAFCDASDTCGLRAEKVKHGPGCMPKGRLFFENCWWQTWGCRTHPKIRYHCLSCPDLPGGRCPGR